MENGWKMDGQKLCWFGFAQKSDVRVNIFNIAFKIILYNFYNLETVKFV